MKKLRALVMPLLLVGALVGCRTSARPADTPATAGSSAQSTQAVSEPAANTAGADAASASPTLDPDGFYYDVEHVVLYLDEHGDLPANYVTKAEARSAGWEGGTPSQVFDGAAIGGDRFGNYEGALPDLPRGSEYRECDIDTGGRSSRGARRLIYTDDGDPTDGMGPYYYTEDHYETFSEVEVEDGEVVTHE